jgi:hypothetical protein
VPATHTIRKLEFARILFWQINQFNHCLRHTYFPKIQFREKLILRGEAIQPIQPLDAQVCVSLCLVRKDSAKNGKSTISRVPATHTIRKLEFARILFWRINQFNHCLRHTYVPKIQFLLEINLARTINSTNSTTRCAGL